MNQTFQKLKLPLKSRTLSTRSPTGTEEIEIIGSIFGGTIEETPVEESPVEEALFEESPVEETPVEESPVEETPVEESPVEKAYLRILLELDVVQEQFFQDGVCVLDKRCGPGTILQDGVCVIVESKHLHLKYLLQHQLLSKDLVKN